MSFPTIQGGRSFPIDHGGGGGGGLTPPIDPGQDGFVALASAGNLVYLGGSAAGQALVWNGAAWTAATLDPATGVTPGAVNTVLWTGAGPAVSWTGSTIISGSLSIGTAPFAAAGSIRLPNNPAGGALAVRNAANTLDIAVLSVSAANVLTINGGVGTAIVIGNALTGNSSGSFTSGGGQTVSLTGVLISFAALSVTPAINQAVDATATIVGDTFTIGAQNVSGNTATTGGMMFLQGGDATGTGGTHNGGAFSTRGGDATGAAGTRNGGDWLAEPGSGATANGSLRLRNAASTDRIVIDSTGIGFFAVAPVARPAAYTPTNVTPDRSYDADTVVVAELADVVGTMIADLQAYGLFQ